MNKTKERPIIFSGEMVRAILEGRKTQTRRVVKMGSDLLNDPRLCFHLLKSGNWECGIDLQNGYGEYITEIKCPYGQPGDRLWVRETWGVGCRPHPHLGWIDGIEYRADESYLEDDRDMLPLYSECVPDNICLDDIKAGWRPSIHMPRWASRILLEITDVRVERVQDISEEDALSEGGNFANYDDGIARAWFAMLWDDINEKRGYGWDANPWVWVVEFKII